MEHHSFSSFIGFSCILNPVVSLLYGRLDTDKQGESRDNRIVCR